MRVEKLMKSVFVFACIMAIAISVTSCSEDDDPVVSNIITYRASGTLSGDLSSLLAIPAYNEAIRKVIGESITSEKDNEVIAACDAVYEDHRKNHPAWKGTIEIHKIRGTSSPTETSPSTVIKTYKYE